MNSMVTGLFTGFVVERRKVPGADLLVRRGGPDAPVGDTPVLLLHGWPQTGAMWNRLAADLARDHEVVVPDLRGYGGSRVEPGDGAPGSEPERGSDLTFRAMAADAVSLMADLGHDRFHVVAHDRGARAAHRMALDHPDAVASLVLIDILPTLEVWRTMDARLARRYFHWTFLAQPEMPARLISADPLTWLHHNLGNLGGGEGMEPEAVAEYEAAARDPDVVRAWCADYAAGASTDLEHDEADEGRTLPHPTLVLWGEKGVVGAQVDPVDVWRARFPAAHGESLDAGHFLVEQRPDEVAALVRAHLTDAVRG